MAENVLEKGTLLPETIVNGLINNVKGRSSLARLCASTPIPFNGLKEFTFDLDKDVDIVAESGKKSTGGGSVGTRTIVPIKFEYSMRVSDEFMYGSEAYQLGVLESFSEGFARKIARGIDIAAFHGLNPRTKEASTVVGDNHFDKAAEKTTVTRTEADADVDLESAVQKITDSENVVTGIAMAPAFAADMAKVKVNGVVQYPEFRFGGHPANFAGMALDVNGTVSEAKAEDGQKDLAIIGDFTNYFRWGYAKEIPLEVIEYGNPDNDETLGDLKGHNQVLLRCEAYVGWGILDPAAFAIIKTANP